MSELSRKVDDCAINFTCLITGINDKEILEKLEATAIDRFKSAFEGYRLRFTEYSDSTWMPRTDSGTTKEENTCSVTIGDIETTTVLTVIITFTRRNAPEMSRIAQELTRQVFVHLSHHMEDALRSA